jgi:exodeoxyribonuclease X
MKLIVVDTETSDLPENGGQLLELAWMVLQAPNWEVVSSYENYVQYTGPLNPCAQASNHIVPAMLTSTYGALPKEKVLADLVDAIEPDSILVAHNVAFDREFLPGITNPWICTYRVSKRIWPEAPGHSNQVLRYYFGIKPDLSNTPVKVRMPHQALYDVATTTGIVRKMLEKHSPEELVKISWNVQKLRTMPFGKHKGKAFNQIPCDYLVWLRNQSRLDPDLAYTLDSVLSGG